MKTARWTLGLTGVALMTLALGCENGNPPTAPALSKTAVATDAILPDGEAAADVTFTTIDVPGAAYTEVNDINARGQMVGRYHDGPTCSLTPTACNAPDGHTHGYLLSDGVFTTVDPPGSIQTGAVGVSPHGDVVGFYVTTSGGVAHGFLLSDGAFTSYDFPAATFTRGQGMSAQGDIVGEYHAPDNSVHGFLLREGAFTAIDVPGAVATSAWRINAAGDIVGRYRSPDGKEHVFLLSGGQFTSVDFPGAFSTAPARIPFIGINAQGDIVGSHCDAACTPLSNGTVHGFLLSEGAFTSFDFPGGSLTAAAAINDRGVIVGAYKDRPTTPTCTVSPACAQIHGYLRSSEPALVPVTGTFIITLEPVSVRQADGNTVTDFSFHEQISGSIAGVRVGTGTLVVHPDGTLAAVDAGVFTGTVAGVSGSVIIPVRAEGTFAALTATATFDGSSGTGGLRGLRGTVRVTGAATGPTTIAGSYEGQVHFQATAANDDD